MGWRVPAGKASIKVVQTMTIEEMNQERAKEGKPPLRRVGKFKSFQMRRDPARFKAYKKAQLISHLGIMRASKGLPPIGDTLSPQKPTES